jgi:cytoskeletal protein CcmA (bactofilin family)
LKQEIKAKRMFSKGKEPEVAPPPPPVAQPKRNKANDVPSVISPELIVKGTLISAGDVQVEGKIDGDIRASGLVIGEKAIVVGDVYAEEAVVRGRVEGSIRARRVQLCATCHVEGNILHEALSVESGAFFEGNCRHTDNPLADAPEASPPVPKSARSGSAIPGRPAQSQAAPAGGSPTTPISAVPKPAAP